MFGRRKGLRVKKDVGRYKTAEPKDPLKRHISLKQSEFKKNDIPEENAKSMKKLLVLALLLAGFWFLRECWLSWNIFS